MATTIVDWLNDGTIPQSKTSGSWTPSNFNTGKFRFTLTFTAASTGSPWRPGSLTYWGVLTTNEANGAAIWLEYNPSGTVHTLLFVGADGTTILGSRAFTWGASTAVTVTIDQSSATAGASTMTIAGASSGNGTTTGWNRASVFGGANLYFGVWGTGGFQFPAGSVTTSDIDDANDAVTRTAAGSNAVDAVLAVARTVIRAAAGTVAVAAALTASRTVVRGAAGVNGVEAALAMTATGGEATRTAAGTNAVDATLAATRMVVRSAAGSNGVEASLALARTVIRSAAGTNATEAALAMTVAGAVTFGLGVTSSAIATFGHSAATLSAPGGYLPSGGGGADEDGRTPTAVATQATGSAIYALAARPTSVNTALTDNYSNAYASVEAMTFEPPWVSWEIVSEVAIGAAGGSNHIVTTGSVVSDEATLIWTEIKQCAHLADSSAVFRGVGTSLVSVGVDLDAPGWVFVDALGDSGTFGAEDFPWTIAAVGEGATVGTHWQRLDSRLLNHNDGWIPVVRFARYYSAATSGITLTIDDATINPDQGVYLFAAAFQEVNVTVRDAAGTNTVAAALAAARTVVRSAAGTNAVTASLAAQRTAIRAAAGTNAVEASLAANRAATGTAAGTNATAAALAMARTVVRSGAGTNAADATLAMARTVARSAAGTNAVEAALAAARAVIRSAAGTVATDAALAAARQIVRAAAGTNAVEAALAATLVPAGTAVRDAAGANAVDAVLAMSRTVVRAAAGDSVVGADLAMARAVVRPAAGANAVGAALAMTVAGATVASIPLPSAITFTDVGDDAIEFREV